MIDRIKGIIVSPKAEWAKIAGERKLHVTVLVTWVLILAVIPAVATLIGNGVIGRTVMGVHVASMGYGVKIAIANYLASVLGVYFVAVVIWLLAPSFGSEKNFDQAFSLAAYSQIPAWVGGIFMIIPALSWIATLCGIWSLVLLYLGLKPMMKTSDDKIVVYFIVALLAMLVSMFVLAGVIAVAVGAGSLM